MSDRPVLEDGVSTTNEAFTYCDCCEKVFWWDELTTGDDGETWICRACQPPATPVNASEGSCGVGNE